MFVITNTNNMGEVTLEIFNAGIEKLANIIDGHARIMKERLIGIDERLEIVEGKADIILFEVRDHDKRVAALEAESQD